MKTISHMLYLCLLLLCTLVIAICLVAGLGKAESTKQPGNRTTVEFNVEEQLEREWAAQYTYLQRQLAGRRYKEEAYRSRQDILRTQTLRQDALLWEDDRDPVDVVLRRTRALLEDLIGQPDGPRLDEERIALIELERRRLEVPLETDNRFGLFVEVCKLRRKIAFSNPLLDFEKIIFLKHHKVKAGPGRLVAGYAFDQYFGFGAVPGGDVNLLCDPFSDNPKTYSLLEHAVVSNGRLQGRRLEGGSFISLDLSYDAETILFAWTQAKEGTGFWSEDTTYHIFKANADGSGLIQITDGKVNDFDPCFLPNGQIVFISERRGGYGRCHSWSVPNYTLHSMKDDGSDITTLSFHESNEWHPSVDNNGMVVYTRWDYVDRDGNVAHNIWSCYPDGRDPRSYHGNYPILRENRPWMEMSIRAVPGSHKYVAVAAGQHGQAYGSLILIDLQIEDDNAMSQVKRITPEVYLPESEFSPGQSAHNVHKQVQYIKPAEVYGTPWPLSEDYYLCVYDRNGKNYGLYLVDSFGNKELLYVDPEIPCLDPIPFKPRAAPPVIPTLTRQTEEDDGGDAEEQGIVGIINIYDSDFEWPSDTKIASLRVVQLFPKTTPLDDEPRIGAAIRSSARGVLGTVPVEPDGSVHFKAPASVPIYFQALDENGTAIQSMRSATYLHPGERLTCQGCHEPKGRTVDFSLKTVPLAFQRPPSGIKPDVDGSYPLLYPRLVQGVLDRNCVKCHDGKNELSDLTGEKFADHGWSSSFRVLSQYGWGMDGLNGSIEANGGSRSIAGNVGAMASELYKMLKDGHQGVTLSKDDLYRITLWLDCNTNYYGVYERRDKQMKGEIVMPTLE